MLRLTESLKAWLRTHCGVDAEGDEATFRRAAADAMTRPESEGIVLTPDKLAELTKEPEGGGSLLLKTLQGVAAGQDKLAEHLAKLGQTATADPPADPPSDPPEGDPEPEPGKGTDPDPKVTAASKRVSSPLEKIFAGIGSDGASALSGYLNPGPDVKAAHKQYSTDKRRALYKDYTASGRRHSLAGQEISVTDQGGLVRGLDEPSDLEQAINGAYLKMVLTRGGTKPIPKMQMTDHDWELIFHAAENCKWAGVLGGEESAESASVYNRKLHPHEQKQLIDDAISGGLEMAPIFFDDQVILTPLQFGELFPSVNLVNIARGRRIESATMANQTVAWGGGDDNLVALFNTAAFVAAFDTTIHVVDGAIEVGLDFMSDSPIDVASIIVQQYGNRLQEELDRVIAIGNGATEPEGIMNAAGTTAVAMGGAAPTIGQYEQLLFAVPKQFKRGFATNRILYAANETSYRRARAIAVGATDARRLFGMTHEDYMLFGHPYAIVTTMANTQIFFANMARYRMYRRMGMVIKQTTEGRTLTRSNLLLILMRARYGGQLEDGLAGAIVSTAQA